MKPLLFFSIVTLAQSQFFDPVIDDKTYLDRVDLQLTAEVESSAMELIQQANITEKVTKSYIAIKLKDNVLKALRTLALAESVNLEETVKKPYRSGRQDGGGSSGDSDNADSEQSEGGDDESATERATTPLTGLSTAVKINQNVFQFIGEAIKTIFKGVGGGGAAAGKADVAREGLNDSSLTTVLPSLMLRPYAEQLVGIVNLFRNPPNNSSSASGGSLPARLDRLNPFKVLFGNRARAMDPEQKDVVEYIENVRQTYPTLLPDLYSGITESQRLLDAMSKVVTGIRQDFHT